MNMKVLSHYDNDMDTRFGDCILVYNQDDVIMFDCGHDRHAQEVENFLAERKSINNVHIVVSHNDSDHTDGVIRVMEYLADKEYNVTIYTSLYLKSAKKVLDLLDDERRTPKATKEKILKLFDKIEEIVNKANALDFVVVNALPDTDVASATIVGPTEDEFAATVAEAIETDGKGKIEGETVMNAASLQLKCTLKNQQIVLLCGDAAPGFLHDLETYDLIQLPHHGQYDDGIEIFDMLDESNSGEDSYSKSYLISDNTGSGDTSGGSDDLVKYMKKNKYKKAYNTQDGVIKLPDSGSTSSTNGKNNSSGVKLGVLDNWC